ncbi:putative cytosolic regulator pianissimo protein [Neofusicoccum parvum UCRNP2]|uniref:Putative cytosolic regulator pianissimo protein n=1 Tax=Botryosphaeria parva (strain UCR-NP2) TaxID=1287680 RepID=R1G923_BOTPV|nr:putative cytosolic regulator pianissimo protein [Neofusicoccum parvum UCRNP2]
MSSQPDVPAQDHHNLLPPGRPSKDGRAPSVASYGAGVRGNSYATTIAPGPGSFSSDLRSIPSRSDARPSLAEHTSFAGDDSMRTASEHRQAELRDQIEKETKIKIGSENLLEALNSKNAKQAKEQKSRVEAELNISNRKLANLKLDLETEIQRAREPVASEGRLSFLFRNAPSRSESYQNTPEEVDPDTESPTLVLADILQALEAEGMQPDYYVEKGNSLVELFKRHPTLKFDLAWSIFGLRVQMMLLSDSREVVAAGYRVMRHAIADRKSLQTIRSFQTDLLVILSLVKESKVSVEREQALKFIRAFLEVEEEETKRSLVDHYVAVMLAVLLHSGLVPALLHAEEDALNLTLKRKTTLLLDGTRYLMDSKPIRQLGECLSHFDRMSGLTSEEPIFSVERMAETLTGGYFAMLGELSKKPEGVIIFERWKMINMFYHIVELRTRDDLMMTLLSNMDYTLDGHLRIILSKAMTAGTKEIRIFSTRLLRKYATKPLQPDDALVSGTGVAEWAIRLLVTQLYDPEIEVCEVAIKILEEACNQKRSLEYVVKCAPTLDHLGEIGAPLLLRFLSTSVGYHYLDGLDYITREMDDWFLGRNDSYVALVEASLARALADIPEKPPSHLAFDELPDPLDFGLVPPHFYRELARTAEGCKLLEAKGHFEEFASTIKDYCMENEDTEIIMKVKGCLWAVGNVGSMDLGAPFLENTDVTKYIVQIAEESEVMSLRGTAFFVLGLISRSLHGQEILIENGWDATTNIMGESLGFCIPVDFKKLFSIKPWGASPAVIETNRKPPAEATSKITDNDPLNARILKLVTDLGNTVLAKRAANDLHRYVY